MKKIPARALAAAFVRSLTIQASWNYRTMVGGGFGFSILPVLRWIFRDDPDGLVEATGRHVEHFNAHPYLAGLAIGASARLEADGADPEAVRRFKAAVRGPLGGIGDRLVWAGWLPATLIVGMIMAVVGIDPAVVAITFLVLYNVGHVVLRLWAFRAGVEAGAAVAGRIQAARLGRVADRVQTMAAALLGLLTGLLAARILGGGALGGLVLVMAAISMAFGARLGQKVWRPMAAALIMTTLVLTIVGALT